MTARCERGHVVLVYGAPSVEGKPCWKLDELGESCQAPLRVLRGAEQASALASEGYEEKPLGMWGHTVCGGSFYSLAAMLLHECPGPPAKPKSLSELRKHALGEADTLSRGDMLRLLADWHEAGEPEGDELVHFLGSTPPWRDCPVAVIARTFAEQRTPL